MFLSHNAKRAMKLRINQQYFYFPDVFSQFLIMMSMSSFGNRFTHAKQCLFSTFVRLIHLYYRMCSDSVQEQDTGSSRNTPITPLEGP